MTPAAQSFLYGVLFVAACALTIAPALLIVMHMTYFISRITGREERED